MILRQPNRSIRRGATLVETAVVISVFLLFMFGIFEYARFVMVYQSMQNAAREGARYGVAVINQDTLGPTNVQDEVRRRLKGANPNLNNFNIQVSGVALNDPTLAKGTALSSWTAAPNYDGVMVTIDYNFQPALPSFLMWKQNVPMHAEAVMYSEGN